MTEKSFYSGLIAFDLDSTLIQAEGIDEFARELGVYDQVSAITEEAMKGNLLFEESFRRRVSLLKGLSVEAIERVASRISPTPGAHEVISTLKKRNYLTVILSGGFHSIGDRIRSELGIDFIFANSLQFENDEATGHPALPIIDSARKAVLFIQLASKYGIPHEKTIAVGDGANDIPMFQVAGKSFAFNGKPIVEAAATHSIRGLSLLPLLGLLDD